MIFKSLSKIAVQSSIKRTFASESKDATKVFFESVSSTIKVNLEFKREYKTSIM